MAFYDFRCSSCPSAPTDKAEDGTIIHADAEFSASYPMAKAPPFGFKRKCPCCGRKTAARVASTGVAGIIRGHDKHTVDTNYAHHARVGGQEVRFNFIDHKMGDPALHRDLSAMAKKQGIRNTAGLANARYDPKLGRTVVDVASNVMDPLGVIDRSKESGNYSTSKTNVGTKVKTRPGVTDRVGFKRKNK